MYKYLLIFLFASVTANAQNQTVGVFYNTEAAQNGYTLFASSASHMTYLIDNCGNVVNSWESAYNPGSSVYLLENGNLLRTARIQSPFIGGGTGGRLELFSWQGVLLWSYNYSTPTYHQHHDVQPLPGGNILLIAWELKTVEEAVAAGRDPEFLDPVGLYSERIVELEPVGNDEVNVVWEWHLWDHLIQDFDDSKPNFGTVNEHPELMDLNYLESSGGLLGNIRDWIHLNAINYNAALDQIVVSSRHLSEVWIIDHSTTTAEAAGHTGGNSGKGGGILYRWGNPETYGRGTGSDQRFYGQHDVKWIPLSYPDGGKIMVYNNGLGRPGGSYSSVDVIAPPLNGNGEYVLEPGMAYGPDTLSWTYVDDPPNQLFSSIISGAQRLSNGNTLICEGRGGHFEEVTYEGESAWEYIVPINGDVPVVQGEPAFGNDTFRATRYPVDYPAFTNNFNAVIGPIEVNATNQDCVIFADSLIATKHINEREQYVEVYPNPFAEYINIVNEKEEFLRLNLFDLTGKVWYTTQEKKQTIRIETSYLPNTIYLLEVQNESGEIQIVKIFKTQ